jgi:hypothetical protein
MIIVGSSAEIIKGIMFVKNYLFFFGYVLKSAVCPLVCEIIPGFSLVVLMVAEILNG